MGRALRLLNIVALLAWPFLVWLAVMQPKWRSVIGLLAVLFVVRVWSLRRANTDMHRVMLLLAVMGCVLCLASLLLRTQHILLWYPVVVNALMLMLFAGSLWSAMPLVERLARLREPHLPPRAQRYTLRVTQLWCVFFIFNGGVALMTCLLNNVTWWTLWNGCISYVLMGTLMAGEWLFRQRMRNKI